MKVEEIEVEFRKRVKMLYALYRQNISDFEKVQEIVNEYYKKPEKVLRDLGIAEER